MPVECADDLRDRLRLRIRQALEPARFPERRDVELAFSVSPTGEGVAFFDHFWTDSATLWMIGALLEASDLEGYVAAVGQRELLRALAAELKDPAAVADEWRGGSGGRQQVLSIFSIDATTGELAAAGTGEAANHLSTRLEPGGLRWMVIGDAAVPQSDSVPLDGLQALVDGHATTSMRVLAAVHYKNATRKAKSVTLTVRNDSSAVPDALAAIRSHLERNAVAEADADALELVLDELLTNQINYGFRDGMAHEILVEVDVEAETLSIELRDDGVPFDPLSVRRPDLDAGIDERQLGGLGMHFVRTLVDDVSYRRQAGWNVIALAKSRAREEEEQS